MSVCVKNFENYCTEILNCPILVDERDRAYRGLFEVTSEITRTSIVWGLIADRLPRNAFPRYLLCTLSFL